MKTITIIRYSVIFIILLVFFSQNHFTTAQTKWYKYTGNPDFYTDELGEGDHNLYPFKKKIIDGNQYQMWFKGKANQIRVSNKRGYATTIDGIILPDRILFSLGNRIIYSYYFLLMYCSFNHLKELP